MNRSYRTDAIVLRRLNFGETDRILTLFSRDRGKLSSMAKGARRPKSSLAGASELGSYSVFQLAMGTNLEVVAQAELRNAFLGLRASLARLSRALYLLEFCGEFTEEHQPHADLFDTLLSALYALETGEALDWIVAGFEAQALTLLGYAPQTRTCVSCGRAIGPAPLRYSAPLGGVLCSDCSRSHRDSVRISRAAIDSMEHLVMTQLPVLGRESPVDPVALEVRRVLRAHIRYRAEKEMKSVKFVEQLRAEADNPVAGEFSAGPAATRAAEETSR